MPSSSDSTAALVALMDAADAQRQAINTQMTLAVSAQVRAFEQWWDSVAITGLAQKLQRIVGAGQRRMATSTDAYGSRILSDLTGRRVQPIGSVVSGGDRFGTPLESVYGRLADEYRYLTATRSPEALARPEAPTLPPMTPEQILEWINRRAETQTVDNLTIALRQQWSAVTDAAPGSVVGYRRVIHPELAKKSGTCGLCIVASDHLYKRGDLMPIHSHCNCGVSPVVGDLGGAGDPGSALNGEDLDRLYAHAGNSTSGKDLRKTKYKLVDGELGPTLVFAQDHHRGLAAVAADIGHPIAA